MGPIHPKAVLLPNNLSHTMWMSQFERVKSDRLIRPNYLVVFAKPVYLNLNKCMCQRNVQHKHFCCMKPVVCFRNICFWGTYDCSNQSWYFGFQQPTNIKIVHYFVRNFYFFKSRYISNIAVHVVSWRWGWLTKTRRNFANSVGVIQFVRVFQIESINLVTLFTVIARICRKINIAIIGTKNQVDFKLKVFIYLNLGCECFPLKVNCLIL